MFDFSQLPLFALADRKFAWIDQRQQVLAQNIANADTPGWRARDVKPFAALLAAPPLALASTAAGHFAAGPTGGGPAAIAPGSELAPDGNGVVLDKEMMKVAETDANHVLTTELTRSWLGMFRTAIGR